MDSKILELLKDRSGHIWIGDLPPFPMPALNILDSTAYRVAPQHHGAYKVVWYYENLLSDLWPSRWPIVLDELVRLIGEEGRLVVRFAENQNFSIVSLKRALARRFGLTVDVVDEHFVPGRPAGYFVAVFDIKRSDYATYRDNSWSFIVLAQGKRTPDVKAFLESVRKNAKSLQYEVIIVGPNQPDYDGYNVKVIDTEYREQYAEISRKKNDAVEVATGSNVCILHDRYILADNFFEGFEKFGYDFDFVAVKQAFESGKSFPFYTASVEYDLIRSISIDWKDYKQVMPTQYVNGGFMVFKRNAIKSIKFNSLLFWDQAEDVELSREFMARGLPPRVNLFSVAVTSASSSYQDGFIESWGLRFDRARFGNWQRVRWLRRVGRSFQKAAKILTRKT